MSVLLSMLLQAAASAPPTIQEPATLPDDKKIVCRMLAGTGSRLNNQRICLPKKEWRRLAEGGEEVTREMQDKSTRGGPVQ